MKKVMQMLVDMYDKDQIGSKDLARTAQTALDRDSRNGLFSGDIITIH